MQCRRSHAAKKKATVSWTASPSVETELSRLGVPREAVVIEEAEPVITLLHLPSSRDHGSSLQLGEDWHSLTLGPPAPDQQIATLRLPRDSGAVSNEPGRIFVGKILRVEGLQIPPTPCPLSLPPDTCALAQSGSPQLDGSAPAPRLP